MELFSIRIQRTFQLVSTASVKPQAVQAEKGTEKREKDKYL